MKMASLLRLARSGRPDLAAINLGAQGHGPRALRVLSRYTHTAGRTFPVREMYRMYLEGRARLRLAQRWAAGGGSAGRSMFFYVGSGASENREVHAWMRRIGFVSNTEDSYWHRAGRCARVQRVAPGTHLIVWE